MQQNVDNGRIIELQVIFVYYFVFCVFQGRAFTHFVIRKSK